jgi:NAD(P)-dependent dehydrogenase (short-subunit alcohol dehydrogenase family)
MIGAPMAMRSMEEVTMSRSRVEGKTVLVTGAAEGIGRETALAFARAGADLIVCDVNERRLADTAEQIRGLGRDLMERTVDVSDREAMRAFADEVHADREAVDILVNNAGVGHGGGVLDTSLEDWDWVVSINLMGVVHGCHYFVPPMVARGKGGHVVNLSSAAGILASRLLAAYATTKFGVFGLTEALREELRPLGIGVTVVCPGLISTAIAERGRMRGQFADDEIRENVYQMYRDCKVGPDAVANAILKGVYKNKRMVLVAPEAWAGYYGKRVFPNVFPRLFGRGLEKQIGLR